MFNHKGYITYGRLELYKFSSSSEYEVQNAVRKVPVNIKI